MNDIDTKNLYRWQKTHSTKHDSKLDTKVKEANNIQSIHEWMRKVEDASDKAVTKVFAGTSKTSSNNAPKSSQTKLDLWSKFSDKTEPKKQIKTADDPYSEAHDLINGWVADKIRFDMDDDFYNYVDVEEVNKFTTTEKYLDKIRKEIMADEEENDPLDIKGFDYDKYDENYIARDIVNKMMKKEVVDTRKLALDDGKKPKKGTDLQMKIELRHQAVKMNREKRNQEVESKRRERLEKKEIELKARQMVEKEERDKLAKQNIEQQLIDQEVERLRLEMAEQRRADEEIRRKQKEIEKIRQTREAQELANIRKKIELENIENGMEAQRNEMAEKRANDLCETYLRTKNIRMVQKAFSLWYGQIMEARLQVGKANALADWKLSSKVFNAWKRMSISERMKREHETYQSQMKYEQMKIVHAKNFHEGRLLKKCLDAWTKATNEILLKKKLDEERALTKSRMQKFLDAAAEGRLWQEEDDGDSTNRSDSKMVDQHIKSKSQRLSGRVGKLSVQQRRKNSLDSMVDRDELSTNVTVDEKKVREMMAPFVKGNVGSKFENRFRAQEKILREQHEMIKEQKRMIEEMKYEQNQVAFKEQIALLEEIKKKQLDLEDMQKSQYKQEKKLLRQQAELIKNRHKMTTPREVDNSKQLLNAVGSVDSDEDAQDWVTTPKSITSPKSNEMGELVSVESNLKARDKSNQPSTRSTGTTSNATSVFNRGMEERAKQREQMKKEREEKKRKQEMERLELLRARDEEKLRLEEEERKKKNEELKEKRRIQKELEDKRNAEKIKEQQLNKLADNFYRKHLLRYYCMNGLKKLMEQHRFKLATAQQFYANKITGLVVSSWRVHTVKVTSLKREIADDFNRKRMLKIYFTNLKLVKKTAQIAAAKAARHYRQQLKVKLFTAMRVYTSNERMKAERDEVIVLEHNEQRIRAKCLKEWRQFPAEQKRLREKQKRIEDLRSKVRQMIPDYGD